MTLYMPLFRSCTSLRLLTHLHAHLCVTGLHHDPLASTKLIESYAQLGSPQSSTLVFKTFPNPDSFMCCVLMKSYVWSNCFQHAISLYHSLALEQAHINSFIFPSVLRASSGLGDLGLGRKVHGRLIKCGFDDDAVIQTSLLRLYGEMGCFLDAEKVFDRMPVRDVISWSSIISSYVENGLVFEGLDMFRLMVLEGVSLDSVTMLSVAEACAELCSTRLARSVHCHILKRGIEGNGSVAQSLVTTYSKCGDLCSAERIFANANDQSTSLWTSMISSYNRSSCFQDAIRTFLEMLEANVNPNSVTVMSVLGSCSGLNWSRQGMSVHCYIVRTLEDPDYDLLAPALIELYANCGKVSYCQKVLNANGKRHLVSWNVLITKFAQKGLLKDALSLFVQMLAEGLMPDSFSLSSSLSACADGGSLQLGSQIHGYISKIGVSGDFVPNSLIEMYSKCGFVDLAFKAFEEIEQKSVVTWNSMICGFCQNGYSLEAIGLFDKMYLSGLEVNEVTFLSVIQACSSLGYLEKGKWVHNKLITFGVDKDLYINNTLCDMYAKAGDLHAAQIIFDNMSQRSVVSWSAMIAGYGIHGLIHDAISLFNEMVNSGISPNQVAFMNILSACSHAGSVEAGKYYFNMMGDCGVEPNSEHYACMVDLLSRSGDLIGAYTMIKSLPSPADASIWASLLNGCRIHHRIDMIKTIERDISELSTDDSGFFTLISNVYAEVGNWNEFGRVRSLMRGIGLQKVPGYSVIELDKKAYRFGAGDTDHLQREDIQGFLQNFHNLAQKEVGFTLENSCLKLDSNIIADKKDLYVEQEVGNSIWSEKNQARTAEGKY